MKAGGIQRALAVLALVGAVGACSRGDDGRGAEDAGSRADGAVDYSLDHGGQDSIVPGSAELEASLLTLDDLPDGMVDLDLSYTAVETCGMRTEMPESLRDDQFPTGAAAFALAEQPIVPDVFEKIVVAPSGTGAEVFQRARDTLDTNCNSGGEADGLAYRGARELVGPTLGDDTFARRATLEALGRGTTVGIDILYARVGDTIVGVGVVEPEGDTDTLVRLATLAFGRAT